MAALTATARGHCLRRYNRPGADVTGRGGFSAQFSGKIAGVVCEGATPVTGAKVHLYFRANGRQISTVRTDQYGAFMFRDLDPTLLSNYFVVALDPDDGVQYNALVYDRLTAVTDLSRTVVSNGFEDSLFGTSSATYGG